MDCGFDFRACTHLLDRAIAVAVVIRLVARAQGYDLAHGLLLAPPALSVRCWIPSTPELFFVGLETFEKYGVLLYSLAFLFRARFSFPPETTFSSTLREQERRSPSRLGAPNTAELTTV